MMGVLLANQRSAPVGHIIEFKENLRILLISVLFILLAARLDRLSMHAKLAFQLTGQRAGGDSSSMRACPAAGVTLARKQPASSTRPPVAAQ